MRSRVVVSILSIWVIAIVCLPRPICKMPSSIAQVLTSFAVGLPPRCVSDDFRHLQNLKFFLRHNYSNILKLFFQLFDSGLNYLNDSIR